MTRYRVKTIPSGELELWIRVGDEWARANPHMRYDLEFDTQEDSVNGTISASDILGTATDDEMKKFLDSLGCQFELHVQTPCDKKPFETIDPPSEIIAKNGKTLLYSKDGGASWFELDLEKLTKPKKNKWRDARKDSPPEDRALFAVLKNHFYPTTVIHTMGDWFSVNNYSNPVKILHWRELPKPPKEIEDDLHSA